MMASILVIEDDEIVRGVLREMLEADGYEVMEASDGNEGIKLYNDKPADLVIMDIFMPTKEGLETISELTKNFRDVKIIAISGGGNYRLDALEWAKMLGATETLKKPFYRKDLLRTVDRVLHVHTA